MAVTHKRDIRPKGANLNAHERTLFHVLNNLKVQITVCTSPRYCNGIIEWKIRFWFIFLAASSPRANRSVQKMSQIQQMNIMPHSLTRLYGKFVYHVIFCPNHFFLISYRVINDPFSVGRVVRCAQF